MKWVLALLLAASVATLSASCDQGDPQPIPKGDDEARIASLVQQLGSPDTATQLSAIRNLKGIGRPAVPHLRQVLKSANDSAVGNALLVLGALDPFPQSALPDLTALLRHTNDGIASTVAAMLVKLPRNREALGHGLWNLRNERTAESILKLIAAFGKLAIPDLLVLVKDPSSRVRAASARALGLMGPAGASSAKELRAMTLREAEVFVRVEAYVALALIQPASRKPLDGLLALLGSASDEDRVDALRGMRRLGTTAHRAIPAIQKLAKQSKSEDVRREATATLSTIEKARKAGK